MEYEFEVWQDGWAQAKACGSDRESALREANHYAVMYGQDGPVAIYEVARTLIAGDEQR